MEKHCNCDTSKPTNQTLNTAALLSANENDPLFYVCWRRQSCAWCLQGDVPCSWCAVTSTCVPNRSTFPILAPIRSAEICPLGQNERWELRALPFGCNVSTMTLLTAVVAVVGTLVAVGLGCLSVRLWVRAWALGRGWRGVDKFGSDGDGDSYGCESWMSRRLGILRRRTSPPDRVPGDMEGYGGEDGGDVSDAERRPLLDR